MAVIAIERRAVDSQGWQDVVLEHGRRSASLSCPQCGVRMRLVHHRISDEGEVWPLVKCSTGCGFRAAVRLLGW